MPRIAIVSEHASPLAQPGGIDSGGQNVYVANVALQLAAQGSQVDIFTRLDCASLPPELKLAPNVNVVHVPAGPARYLPKEALLPYMGDFSRFMQTYFDAQEEPYDLIHANFFMSALAALPVARRAGIPLAVTFHALGRVRRQYQAEADCFPDCRFDIEDKIVQNADCIIAECPQDREDLIQLYGADPERISMVPCGFDSNEMAPMDKSAARALLGWDPDVFYVLQLGRIVPRKGIDNVIKGLARLRSTYGLDARLCVVGGDSATPSVQSTPEFGRLKALAIQEGIENFVQFEGRRPRNQLRRYYCAADVFVTTPWYEPFGITPVEAMACARPVIGSDTGGIRYTVIDGETGYLVPSKSPKALAARLADLANDPDKAQRMGLAGARRANEWFTWDRVGCDLTQLFETLQSARTSSLLDSKVKSSSRLAA
ncbi:glycosyltransferase family 1 protein [Candidimonas sp. SYP-B2681]|uniref:glycosyltransferase family 4 protein n=1 Tax=Candidimonas sp. SYP-B2681 TaxID=2497686 RepID=UPI000F89C172|nr:glycosyltransferase family 1 protein [Candidimonas sp. SYP-B2681]RTZ48145.1 glycosyltransferase family 1 protein [Candidimonas sp. SYP-B2681]